MTFWENVSKYWLLIGFTTFFNAILMLIIAISMFCLSLKLRSNKIWRIILSSCLLLTGSFLIILFRVGFPGSLTYYIIHYILLFVLTVLCFYIVFDTTFWSILFRSTAGYASQHIAGSIRWLIFQSTEFYKNILNNLLLFYIFTLIIALIVYIAIYFVFIRRREHWQDLDIGNSNILMISLLIIVTVIVLQCILEDYSSGDVVLYTVGKIALILICVLVLFIQSGLLNKSKQKREAEVLASIWEIERRQYNLLKENAEIINIKSHDLKHQINMLKKNEGAADEIERIESAVSIYDTAMHTGNEVLDVILTDKAILCRKNNIEFTCMLDGKRLSFMQPYEMYSLFGNALSNAIEAVMKVKDTSKRVIAMSSSVSGEFFSVQIINYFAGELVMQNNLLKTTKNDENFHGYGIKSMRALTKNYGGHVLFSTNDDEFILTIVFPLK